MLLQFSASNYRCFRKLATLNLAASSADKTLPGNCIEKELPGVVGKLWLKGAAIYGANASGKTSIIEALEALSKIVTTSAGMTDPNDPIPHIEPFALNPGETESPTGFGVVFVTEGTRYEYRVAATRKRVWHESLRAFPGSKGQMWFARDWNPDSGVYDWTPERPSGFERDKRLEGDTLGNMLFLSKHIASNRKELEPVFRWFKQQLKFLDLSARGQMGAGFSLAQVEQQTPLHRQIVDLLRFADLGITGARAVEQRPPQELLAALGKLPAEMQEMIRKQMRLQPELTHRGKGAAEVALPWESESAGTRRLFALAGPWLDILASGHTVFVDELETSMHPVMVRELLRLLFSSKTNPNGAQIIFTTHNPLLLDLTLIRRDQVWFTDKDSEGEGHLYPLSDYAPRKTESLVRGYMSGRYGAVPVLPRGLLGSESAYELVTEPVMSPDAQPNKSRRKAKRPAIAP